MMMINVFYSGTSCIEETDWKKLCLGTVKD